MIRSLLISDYFEYFCILWDIMRMMKMIKSLLISAYFAHFDLFNLTRLIMDSEFKLCFSDHIWSL